MRSPVTPVVTPQLLVSGLWRGAARHGGVKAGRSTYTSVKLTSNGTSFTKISYYMLGDIWCSVTWLGVLQPVRLAAQERSHCKRNEDMERKLTIDKLQTGCFITRRSGYTNTPYSSVLAGCLHKLARDSDVASRLVVSFS
ncbi:hypothetical protein J6590_005824 [Homalodisca vitripennis]|nr:hypothetical protein J6590_005824 [Homalodisca vitripennis]